ncbi:unnamed protein product [Caretta caretta]
MGCRRLPAPPPAATAAPPPPKEQQVARSQSISLWLWHFWFSAVRGKGWFRKVFLAEYRPLRKMVTLKTMERSELRDGTSQKETSDYLGCCWTWMGHGHLPGIEEQETPNKLPSAWRKKGRTGCLILPRSALLPQRQFRGDQTCMWEPKTYYD